MSENIKMENFKYHDYILLYNIYVFLSEVGNYTVFLIY